MRIGRTLPPAAAPIGWKSLFHGLIGILHGKKELERLKDELCSYFGKRHCFLVSSGKAALTLILQTLKEQHPDRTEVIIPAYTCFSVPAAIVRAGLEIKLCDLAENSFDFNYERLAPMLNSDKLLAVLPTHLFGLPADVDRLKGQISDPLVTIIEDAAQALGNEWQGKKLGNMGDVGFFSLGRGKALSIVEGGVLLTNDDVLAAGLEYRIENLDSYGKAGLLKLIFYAAALNVLLHPILFWIPRALPFLKLGETIFDPDFSLKKLTAFQAGLSRGWRDKLCKFKKIRTAQVDAWRNILPLKLSFLPKTKPLSLIRLPCVVENRERVLPQAERLGLALNYPSSVNLIPALASRFEANGYPVASRLAETLVTLPVHQYVTKADRDLICELLGEGATP